MAVISLKKHHFLTLAYSLLALAPPIIYIVCVTQNAVNIPFMDEWGLVQFKLKTASEQLSIQDIFAFHNEHRIATLRIISLIVDQWSEGWPTTAQIAISVVISILTFGFLCFLIWRQFDTATRDHYSAKNLHLLGITTVATSLLLFSPVQYENWLWGFQIPWFLINLMLISAVFLLYEFFKTQKILYYWIALGLCLVASFTLAQGLFVWGACLPMFLTRGSKRNIPTGLVGVWLGAAMLTGVAYVTNYVPPAGHPSTNLTWARSGAVIDFFLNLLGNAFGRSDTSNFVLGLIFLTVFCSYIVLCYRQSTQTWNDALVWIAIGLFPILFAATTIVGRFSLGSGAALASRYTTVTLLLPICLVQLTRIFIQEEKSTGRLTNVTATSLLLSGFMLASVISGYQYGLLDARKAGNDRVQGKACLELYQYLEPEFANQCLARYVFPSPPFVLNLMSEMSGLDETSTVTELPRVVSDGEQQIGHFDAIHLSPSPTRDIVAVKGWAFSDGNPGVVLLSDNGGKSFFWIINVNQQRRDVAKAFTNRYLNSGWEASFPAEKLLTENENLTAYFYDFQQRKLSRIGQKMLPN